jgi:crotonobetainyl-CoA:carnitine CoA-transferase CaiB-like acyl-CoA transferase
VPPARTAGAGILGDSFVRIRVLIAVAAALVVALGAKYFFFSGPPPDEKTDQARVKAEQLVRAKDVEGLCKQVQSPDEHAAKLAVSALGDLGEAARSAVEQALVDRRPAVREKAATSFAKVATREQAVKLANIVKKDESPDVRAAAVAGLDRMFAFQEMDAIIDAMEDPDPAVRQRASKAAIKFSGVTVQYYPDASLEECRQGAQRMRQYWEKNKVNTLKLLNSYYQSHYGQAADKE